MSTAAVFKLAPDNRDHEVPTRGLDLNERVQGNARAMAVAKFREIADRIESGELDGGCVNWLDWHDAESKLQTLTRTAWTESGVGTVQVITTVIEEG